MRAELINIAALQLNVVIVLLLGPMAVLAQQSLPEDELPTWDSFAIIGEVQQIKWSSYQVAEDQSTKGELETFTVYTFNENGALTEKTEYASDESIREQIKFVYDDQGNLVERTHFENVRNRATYKRTAEYDEAGNLITMTSFNPDGSIAQKEVTTNDEQGNPIEINTELLNSESQSTALFQYDERGNKIEEKRYHGGNLNWDYKYQYNEAGQLIEKTETRGGDEYPEYKTTYTYDAEGRKVEEEELIYDPDGSVGATTQYTYTYNEGNNQKKVYEEFNEPDRDRWRKRTTTYDQHENLLTDKQEHSSARMNFERSTEYEFDTTGNWINRKRLEAGNPVAMEEREINYFKD